MSESLVDKKAFEFAIKIVEIYKNLSNERKEFVLSRQLLKSGTSIGANTREGTEGQSRKDFISKMSIALKEAAETEYWIDLLDKTNYLNQKDVASLKGDLREIIRMLSSIVRTTKKDMSS